MTEPPEGRLALTERLARIVTGLTIQNVLTIGMLVFIAVPTFIIWKLANDNTFRESFLSSMRIVDLGVPCLVMVGNFAGQPHRTVVLVAYETDGRREFDIAVRSPGQMSGEEVAKACEEAKRYAAIMREALKEK